jgi:deoxyribodipyrimidine photo-lyase
MSGALLWFRRDLRLEDQAALYAALKENLRVFTVFIFDTDILDKLPSKEDRRVEFIWSSVNQLRGSLRRHGGELLVLHGPARDLIPVTAQKLGVSTVYTNHDYEPKAIERDDYVQKKLKTQGIQFKTFKDQVIFEKDEILNKSGEPFKVFTAYKNTWLEKCDAFYSKAYPVKKYLKHLAPPAEYAVKPKEITLGDIGFKKTNLEPLNVEAGEAGAKKRVDDFRSRITSYHERRDFPSEKGPSYLSVHLRFGTVSIRELVRLAEKKSGQKGADTWLSELIWRDFYFMILYHFPEVTKHAFKKDLDGIVFPNDRAYFEAWCEGRTGYPIVDAAMKQINQTGYMHNRLRMVVASFLVKDLQIDWRWGEKYFADHLIDFDLSANNGGWQWSAGTGCDAQPYFRIFNPVTQSEKFDPEGIFIKRYLPELGDMDSDKIHTPWRFGRYIPPIVDHAEERKLSLELFHKT